MNSQPTTTWLSMALIGGLVGAVLAFAIFMATDDDVAQTLPEPPTPTPCENYERLVTGLSSDSRMIIALLEGSLKGARFDEARALYDDCVRSAR